MCREGWQHVPPARYIIDKFVSSIIKVLEK